jgi:asparagine synthase (glutamine-hydrolysing)
MESCIHIHALANLKSQAKHVQILYSGYLIDSLLGAINASRNWFGNYDENTIRKVIFDDLNKDYLFAYSEHNKLFTKEFHNQISDEFVDSFNKVVAESKANSLIDWNRNLVITQRQRRFTENGNEVMRSQVIARTPFCDNDFVEYALTIPPGLRLDRYINIKIIGRTYHNLAKVPWEKTGHPLVGCTRDLMIRICNQTRWRLRAAGLNWIPNVRRRPYADYNHWLRTALRSWVEETLLADRALGRGYFNPDYIQKLVIDHMAGKNHANKLGVLLSLELWHRQFID